METRRKFSREFKLEAVKMVKDRGVAARQVSRYLDFCMELIFETPSARLASRQCGLN